MKGGFKFLSLGAILFLMFFSFITSVSAQNGSEILIVADQKVSCRGIVAGDCLQVKRLDEENYTIFRQNIEGFQYQPGYFYVLEVEIKTVPKTNAEKYVLKKILARVSSDKTSNNKPGFFGTEWKLTSIAGKRVENRKAFIKFDETKNSAGGNGGCNVFGGNLTKNGGEIKITNIFSTKMYCQDSAEIETKFFSQLEFVTQYKIQNGKLMLMAGNKTVLEFEAKK